MLFKFLLYTIVLTTHFNPRVEDIVLWLDRIHILAIIKMIGCYHDNWRSIKLCSKIMHLSRKIQFMSEMALDELKLLTIKQLFFHLSIALRKNWSGFTLQKAKLSFSRGAPPFSNCNFPWNVSWTPPSTNANQSCRKENWVSMLQIKSSKSGHYIHKLTQR